QGGRAGEGRERRSGDYERRDGAVRAGRARRDGGVQAGAERGAGLRAQPMSGPPPAARPGASGYVMLEDRTRFDGRLCGPGGGAIGEVVFNTSMTGYQESVTDPSYAGQIIVFTYPHVGNYGVSARAMESDRIHARAVIMREGVDREDAPGAEGGWLTWLDDCGVPALTGVDTRALVRHIRDKGAMPGGVFAATVAESAARERVMAEPSMVGRDLAREVTPAEPVILDPDAPGPRVVALDTGIKSSIVRNLRERGVRLELHPCDTSSDGLRTREP